MIFIALGSNLPSRFGSPDDTLKAACAELCARGIYILQYSSIWLSAPVPASDQPWYRNAVVEVETALAPRDLLFVLKQIERDFGRVDAQRNAPRVLDLDIIAYHSQIESGDIHIPHPRMHERSFVIMPLAEVAPDWVHPVLQRNIRDFIELLPYNQEIEPLEGVHLDVR